MLIACSVPAGITALALILIFLPPNFPHRPRTDRCTGDVFSIRNFRRLDLVGTFLLLAASILLIVAIEEGGTEFSWHSPVILSLLILSGFLWPGFLAWERYQGSGKALQEPVFPWRMTTDRFIMGCFL